MSYDDPFAGVDPQKPKKPKPRPTRKENFDRPLDVSRREAFKATGTGGSAMHGEYYQLTTRLPLEIVEEIRAWAASLNMTQQDVQRYCFYRGLIALGEGERPEFEEVVVRKKLIPPE